MDVTSSIAMTSGADSVIAASWRLIIHGKEDCDGGGICRQGRTNSAIKSRMLFPSDESRMTGLQYLMERIA
jgi:hypothetical protein